MSDAYYQARARRRTRMLAVVAAIIVVILLVLLGIRALFHDACTGNFERSPTAVVSAYLDAVSRGNVPVAQECWNTRPSTTWEPAAPRSACRRSTGRSFRWLSSHRRTVHQRPTAVATCSHRLHCLCRGRPDPHAEILLDSVSSDLPWRHWAIVHSTFGGTVVEPWCK